MYELLSKRIKNADGEPEVFSFTERESEVFNRLVNTEDSIQMIAEKLYVSRRTLERHISAIYEKTGVKSRVGLLNLYNK